MRIVYFSRNSKAGFSIEKVMRPIINATPYSSLVEMPKLGAAISAILLNLLCAFRNRHKNTIYHITGDVHYLSLVLPKDRTITTVHDLVSISFNQYSRLKRSFIKLLFVKTLKRNCYIVCISEKTKKEVLSQIKFPEERVLVIPDPIDNRFCYHEKEFRTECPIVLHIGTKKNKNLKRSIEALSSFNIKLRIIGIIDEEIKNALKHYKVNYSVASGLSDEQIIEEYRNCDIVNFPSLYEGFGMPLLEAQATGRVCVSSDIEPMRTIAGGSAVLVDPYRVESIREGYNKILHDKELRKRYVSQGLENVKKYKESQVIEAYNKLYHKISK